VQVLDSLAERVVDIVAVDRFADNLAGEVGEADKTAIVRRVKGYPVVHDNLVGKDYRCLTVVELEEQQR